MVYNHNFRQEAASWGNYEWDRVDPGIYAQCFTDMAIGSEGWCKHCQSIEHTSEHCSPVQVYSNSMETGSQGRIKSQRRPGAALVPPPQKRAQMTSGLSLIVSKVTARLGKPVVFCTSAVHAKGHTPSASVIRYKMQSQLFQSELGIIQTAY